MTASFSGNAKAEVCRFLPQKHCCALAESFGVLLFCNSFSDNAIRIITECREFALLLPKLFRKAFSVTFDVLPEDTPVGKFNFMITDAEKIAAIMRALDFEPQDTVALHINLPFVEEDCCRTAFLRGAFLAGGSVTDPAKGYHIELTTTHSSVARECHSLMYEMLGVEPKAAPRAGGYVL